MNININISEVLTKAWKITWKFKVLWIFGILAGCGENNQSSFDNSYTNRGGGSGDWGDGDLPEPFREFFANPQEAIGAFISQYLVIVVGVILLLCILSFLFYFLGLIGKMGLIKGASKADAGAETLSFGELWSESLPYFWRMFGLSLLVGLPFFIIVLVLVILLFAGVFGFITNVESSTGGAVAGLLTALGIFIPAICCLTIVQIAVNMVVQQAQNAIMIEDKGVMEGLSRGWDIFKRNFVTIILMTIILGVLGAIVGFIVAIPLVLTIAPIVAGIVLSGSDIALVPFAIAGICVLAYLPVLLLVGGIEQTYIQSAWTLTYLRLTAPTPEIPPAPPASFETVDAQ